MDLARKLDEGDEVELTIARGSSTLDVTVTAERMSPLIVQSLQGNSLFGAPSLARTPLATLPPTVWPLGRRALWGDTELIQLEPELGEYFDTDRGLLVLRTPTGDAFGLRAGDVITGIGDREPRDTTHALRILQSYDEGEEVNVHVLRRGERMVLSATVPASSKALLGGLERGSAI